MNMIPILRDKRNQLWEQAKTFLADHRDENGLVPDEYLAAYDKMTSDVKKIGEEIKRLEDQAVLDRIINDPPRPDPEIQLKTCPWCGGMASLEKHDMGMPGGHGYPGNTEVYVKCVRCGAIAPTGRCNDIYNPLIEAVQDAIETWNKRSQ